MASAETKRSAKYAGVALAALAGAASFLGIEAAAHAKTGSATHVHDGVYSIHVVTDQGSCRKSYTTKITVSGGQIRATGHPLIQGSGHIGAGGAVSVTLGLLHHAVHGTGKIRDHSGSGKWSSQGLGCGGSWRATRQRQVGISAPITGFARPETAQALLVSYLFD